MHDLYVFGKVQSLQLKLICIGPEKTLFVNFKSAIHGLFRGDWLCETILRIPDVWPKVYTNPAPVNTQSFSGDPVPAQNA